MDSSHQMHYFPGSSTIESVLDPDDLERCGTRHLFYFFIFGIGFGSKVIYVGISPNTVLSIQTSATSHINCRVSHSMVLDLLVPHPKLMLMWFVNCLIQIVLILFYKFLIMLLSDHVSSYAAPFDACTI